jgi:tRNA-specific 2-thiouridylase
MIVKQKVAIGMSGGVDSAVAALLLKEQGFDVIGFVIDTGFNAASIPTVRDLAKQLDIPLHIVDGKKQFQKQVIDCFLGEYEKYLTPNPCVLCNEKIKFGFMMEKAKELGADKIATGHYARIIKKNGKYFLAKGKDSAKDQSYFLYRLSSGQLQNIIFPLGELTKPEVRNIAKQANLIVKNRDESQEICFVQNEKIQDFLKKHLDKKYFLPGVIVDTGDYTLGKHEGLLNYSIGQRRGVDQSLSKTLKDKLYVKSYLVDENKVVVGKEEEIKSSSAQLKNVHFIDQEKDFKNITAKIRYRSEPQKCALVEKDNKFLVEFDKPQFAITPGQHIVFYKGDIVLGGGEIEK